MAPNPTHDRCKPQSLPNRHPDRREAVTLFALPLLAMLLLAIATDSRAQSAPTSAIPPKAFYKAALKDRAPIAPFASVATWLQEGSVVLLDLRSPREFNAGHIKGAISLPATELTDAALGKAIASKSNRVVIYCSNNLNGATRRVALTTLAYPALKQLGYTNVLELESAMRGKFPLALQSSDPTATPKTQQD